MKLLDGITVVDLTRVLSGPYSTMLLADFGADVIKIEAPESGDDSRNFAPFIGKESAYFMSINRGKKSVTLDLRKHEGQELLKKMIIKADVIVENYRPGTMERWNLGYEDLRTVNPKIIYAAVSGFGHSGPYSRKPAYDIVIQAMSGIMSLTGPEGGPSCRVGTSVGDIIPGLYTAFGIMMALYHRNVSGKGQKVDVAMFDGLVAALENAIARFQVEQRVPKPLGNRHPSVTPFDSFSAKDGLVVIGAGSQRLWELLCKDVIAQPELASDPLFVNGENRTKNHKELKNILEAAFSKMTLSELTSALEKTGIPHGPINSIDRVMEDPQLRARDMFVEIEHPVAGKLKYAGIPVKLSRTPGSIQAPAPILGQHTYEVLQKFAGLTKEDIADLHQKGIV